jgi:uncharacterized protein YjbJ (UPF0337 family)
MQTVNKNQVKGGMKEAGGKAQKEFGKAVDSPRHAIKGGMKEAEGKAQKAAGNLQEESRKNREEARRDARRQP